MVDANAVALDVWLRDQANLAEVMAADPRVRSEVAELLALSQRTGGQAAALRGAPAQARLRAVVTPVVSRQNNAGFFVLDRGGLIVASRDLVELDEATATRIAVGKEPQGGPEPR